MTTRRVSKPTLNDDAFVAELVDATRSIKAQLVAHRAALRRGDRLKITSVEEALRDATSEVAVGLDSLCGRHAELATPGSDRAAIVRDLVAYATRPLEALLKAWDA
jgi:hypothetical protein